MPRANTCLKNERVRRGWTQQDLADALGITKLTVGRWERGVTTPSSYFRLKLCALFDKSAEVLGLIAEPASSPPGEQGPAETALAPSSSPDVVGLWSIPYLRNPHFTGRDDLLEQLTHQLSPEIPSDVSTTRCAVLNQPQALKGLGGDWQNPDRSRVCVSSSRAEALHAYLLDQRCE